MKIPEKFLLNNYREHPIENSQVEIRLKGNNPSNLENMVKVPKRKPSNNDTVRVRMAVDILDTTVVSPRSKRLPLKIKLVLDMWTWKTFGWVYGYLPRLC